GRTGAIRGVRDLAQEIARAGIWRVRCEEGTHAAAVVTVPSRDDVQVLAQRSRADRRLVPILALCDGGEIDVVNAPAHERAQTALGHRARAAVAVTVVVDDGRRAGAEEIPRA